MNIYLVSIIEEVGWDEYNGFCIAADNELDARECAAKFDRNSREVWMDNHRSKITEIGIASPGIEAGILMVDFNAG